MFDVSKVDAMIERIADNICKKGETYDIEEMHINSQMTIALAELIKARAELDKNIIIDYPVLPPLNTGNPFKE